MIAPWLALPSIKYAAPAAILGAGTIFAALDANTIAVTIIAASSGLISSFVGWKQWKSESLAERARIDIDEAQLKVSNQDLAITRNDRLVDQLQEQLNAMLQRETNYVTQISDLQSQVAQLTKSLLANEIGAMKLVSQLESQEIEPTWRPEDI